MTFTRTYEVVDEAVAAGYFPPRHPVTITAIEELAAGVVRMAFKDPYIAEHARPAQFVNLFTDDEMMLMPRPFGVSEVVGDEVSIIFAVVGKGTANLAAKHVGDSVDVLGPLGMRPFQIKNKAHYVLVAGGLGVPPLICAAQKLHDAGESKVTAVFGYRDEKFADEIVAPYVDSLLSIDNEHGNVVTLLDQLEADNNLHAEGMDTVLLTCGPLPMMKAVAAWAAKRGLACQLSMEQRMGCGYGTCVLCTIDTVDGRLKVCSDGPVFSREQLGWGE